MCKIPICAIYTRKKKHTKANYVTEITPNLVLSDFEEKDIPF